MWGSIVSLFLNKLEFLKRRYRVWLLRKIGVDIDYSCSLLEAVTVRLGFSSQKKGCLQILSGCCIDKGVLIDCWKGSVRIGGNTFIGPYVVIYGQGNVRIGENSLISMCCKIISSNHTIPPKKELIRDHPNILLPVTIGDDVWLGAGVTVLGGVTIGNGCVVGAGSVVTKSLPPYSVAIGVPAKMIRTRPDSSESLFHSRSTLDQRH